jgi:hypothetical protein
MPRVTEPASETTAPTRTPGTAPRGEPSSNGGLVRVTVNLTPRAFADLQRISEATGLGKTDVINRSLQVYALVNDLLDRGNGSIVVKHPDGTQERIYIL